MRRAILGLARSLQAIIWASEANEKAENHLAQPVHRGDRNRVLGCSGDRSVRRCVHARVQRFAHQVLDWQRTRKKLLDRRGSRINDFELGSNGVVSCERVPIRRLALYEAC